MSDCKDFYASAVAESNTALWHVIPYVLLVRTIILDEDSFGSLGVWKEVK